MVRRRVRQITRRKALTGLGAAGMVLAALPTSSLIYARGGRGRRRDRGENLGWRVTVFRLKSRDTRSCRACRIHHRFMVAISRHHANVNRAHVGCNCPIVRQRLRRADFRRIFLDTKAIRRGIVDLRHLGPEE